jgi:hypothetical protein
VLSAIGWPPNGSKKSVLLPLPYHKLQRQEV